MLLQKLWKAVFSFGTPTLEVWTVVGGEGGWRKEEEEKEEEVKKEEEKEEEACKEFRSCCSLVLLFHRGDENPQFLP